MTYISNNLSNQELLSLVDFIETRYNLNVVPYISYPQRITNILVGDNTQEGTSSAYVTEALSNNKLYGRKNRTWVEIASGLENITNLTITNWDTAYSWGDHSLEGYLTVETDPTVGAHIKAITAPQITQWGNAFSWGNHALAGYALSTQLHDAVTLSGTPNGLTLVGQLLGIQTATSLSAGALSAPDKIKLDSLVVHDAVTLGTLNGLGLLGQEISLALATTLTAGAMSATDKSKLNSLSNYIHATGFTSQPVSPLGAANVISQIQVNDEGHVTEIVTRALSLSNLGVTKGTLSKVDDTNVTLALTGTPVDSLFENVGLTLGWTGTLAVERGGTGVGSFTTGELLVGNGTDPLTTITREGIDTRLSFPASSHTLTFHSDVSITSPLAGQVLTYQGGIWVNSTLAAAGITLTETDPIFVAFRDLSRTANQFYSAPNGTNGTASFRSLVREDIPNIYVRFDTNAQGLTIGEKTNALTNIGAQATLELGNVTGDTIINIANPTARVVGSLALEITHSLSGWVNKTTLTGANIISNLTVNETGHISDWSTRVLTLADLGFVAFDPSLIESTLSDHESRLDVLELNFPLLNGDKNFVHPQVTPLAIWTINHNMGKKPSVTIIDSAGSMIFAKLTYIDLNNIEIDFAGALTAGEAILN